MWKPFEDQQQEEEDSRKRKRADMIKSRGKRVRVLSHDPDEKLYDPDMKTIPLDSTTIS